MKNWTKNNMHTFNIEASDMGDNQQEIADWVENHILKNATPDTIGEMLANADEYITMACEALQWASVPQFGGLKVNIW